MTQLRSLPQPNTDHKGKTVIVTGANVGLGLEAARHFCRLGAAKVILACRDPEKGMVARGDIAASTSRQGVVEVWQVDMSSFQSVKDFCARVNTELDRLDIVVENAGVATGTYVEADGGFESTIAINVVSTFLMLLLLLPTLRRTAARFNVEPKVVIVSSDAHMFVSQPSGLITTTYIFPYFNGLNVIFEMATTYTCNVNRQSSANAIYREYSMRTRESKT